MIETLRTAKAAGARSSSSPTYEDSPGAKLADIVLLCGAQENPWTPAASPSRWRCCYVAEVLLLRYMLDDQQQTNEAQDRTTEALAVKML